METISEQLDNEEAGLTIDRGLEGCIPGLQAFELFITTTFRKKYDKVKRVFRRHAFQIRFTRGSHDGRNIRESSSCRLQLPVIKTIFPAVGIIATL